MSSHSEFETAVLPSSSSSYWLPLQTFQRSRKKENFIHGAILSMICCFNVKVAPVLKMNTKIQRLLKKCWALKYGWASCRQYWQHYTISPVFRNGVGTGAELFPHSYWPTFSQRSLQKLTRSSLSFVSKVVVSSLAFGPVTSRCSWGGTWSLSKRRYRAYTCPYISSRFFWKPT